MTELSFQSKKEKLPNGALLYILKINGSVDSHSVRIFEEMLNEVCRLHPQHLIIICSKLEYLNSTGMGLLIKFVDEFKEQSKTACLVDVPKKVMILFEMLGLTALLDVYPTEQEAVESILSNIPISSKQKEILAPRIRMASPSKPAAPSKPAPPKEEATAKYSQEAKDALSHAAKKRSQQSIFGVPSPVQAKKSEEEEKIIFPLEQAFESTQEKEEAPLSRGQRETTTLSADEMETGALAPSFPKKTPKTMAIGSMSRSERAQQQKPGKSEDKSIAEICRKTTVRFFQKMYPFASFPLLVLFSQETLAENKTKGVGQSTSSRSLQVSKQNPLVEVVPQLPGCLVVPARRKVNLTPELSEAYFEVTPLAEGEFKRACVEIYYQDKLVDTIAVQNTVAKPTLAKLALYLGIASPIVSTLWDGMNIDISQQVPFTLTWLERLVAQMGGGLLFGLSLTALFLILAAVAYWLSRPREATPLEKLLQISTASENPLSHQKGTTYA